MSDFTVTPENCSQQWGNVYDPLTGDQTSIPLRCGQWRDQECPICFNLRLEEMREEIVEASKVTSLRVVPLDQAEDIKSQLSKEEYRRLPTKSGSDYGDGLFIFDNSELKVEEGFKLDPYFAYGLDWTVLANTPIDKRTSGSLGKSVGNPVASKQTEVETMQINVSDIDEESIQEARKESVYRTSFLEPRTIEQAQSAVVVRAACFCEEIVKRGGKVTARKYITVTVEEKQPTWEKLYSDLNFSADDKKEQKRAWNDKHPRLRWLN